VVFTSSSLQNSIKAAAEAKPLLRPPPTGNTHDRYAATKLAQACAAFGWQERLGDEVEVVLVSPGEWLERLAELSDARRGADADGVAFARSRAGFVPTSGLNRASSFLTRMFLYYILSWAPFCTSLKAGKHLRGASGPLPPTSPLTPLHRSLPVPQAGPPSPARS